MNGFSAKWTNDINSFDLYIKPSRDWRRYRVYKWCGCKYYYSCWCADHKSQRANGAFCQGALYYHFMISGANFVIFYQPDGSCKPQFQWSAARICLSTSGSPYRARQNCGVIGKYLFFFFPPQLAYTSVSLYSLTHWNMPQEQTRFKNFQLSSGLFTDWLRN